MPSLPRALLPRSARIGIPLLALGQGLCEAGFILAARWGMNGGGPPVLVLLCACALLRLVFQDRGAALEVKSLRRVTASMQETLLETLRERAVPVYRPAMKRELARALEETIPRAAEGMLARRRFIGSLLQGGVLLPGLFLLSWKIALPAVALGFLAWRVLKWKNGSLRELEKSGSRGRATERRVGEEFSAGLEAASGAAWEEFLRKYGGDLDAARVADWKWRRAQARYPALLETGFFFSLAGLLLAGAFVLEGIDGWLMFSALLVLTYRPIREAARHYPVALQGAVALDEIDALLARWKHFDPRALPAENSRPEFFELQHVSFDYDPAHDSHAVFRDSSLEFRADKTTGITGPNGSGKTTLLRLISGAETPKRGKVLWAAAARPRGVAYLPQRAHPGADWAAWADQLRAERPGFWAELNAVLGVERLTEKSAHPESMSGGERQRMALARAVASDAEFLLLDEPTTGLPANEREPLLGGLLQLWKRGKGESGERARGALIVSHEPFLNALCDTMIEVDRA